MDGSRIKERKGSEKRTTHVNGKEKYNNNMARGEKGETETDDGRVRKDREREVTRQKRQG